METIKTDVLVVGGGAAGARAALEANRAGADTLFLTKGKFGHSGTSNYQVSDVGGFGASGFVDPNDSPDVHYNDIIEAAEGTCNPSLAKIVAFEAPRHLLYLDSIGVPFEKQKGKFLASHSCFSSKPRSIKVRGHGYHIVNKLKKEIKKSDVNVIERSMAISPLLDNRDNCVGSLVLYKEEKLIKIIAKSTILATGGAGQLFEYSFNPEDVTGDGQSFGLLAGANLVNMEFMQAGVGIINPYKDRDAIFQYWLWELFPSLITAKGEDFLSDYIPDELTIKKVMKRKTKHYPFSTSDSSKFIEISIQSYITDQRKKNKDNTVWMRLSDIEKKINNKSKDNNLVKMWPLSKDFFNANKIDLSEKQKIACFAHAMSGGLVIDQFGKTIVDGLYAAGEVAGGPHGANRLGGNMFPITQIFGERAGFHAAYHSRNSPTIKEKYVRIAENNCTKLKGNSNNSEKTVDLLNSLRSELQRVASDSLLIVREEDKINKYIEKYYEIKETLNKISANSPLVFKSKIELENLCRIGMAIALSAQKRKESRGSHYRKDFPDKSEEYNNKRNYIYFQDDEFHVKTISN